MKYFIVWHEKDGFITVPAENEEHAKEVFYECLENLLGCHTSRENFVKVTRVVGPYEMGDAYCTHDNLKKINASFYTDVCLDCGARL